MKLGLSFAIALSIAGCTGKQETAREETPSPPPVASATMDIGQATLTGIYDHRITLRDGSWEGEPWVEGGAARPRVWWLPRIVHDVDLDDDGRPDALAYFGENSGGTGEFLYLAWLTPADDGRPRSQAVHRIGDRVQVISSRLEGKELQVRLIAAGPDDAACCPRQIEERRFTFAGGAIDAHTSIVGPATLAEIAGIDWTLERMTFDASPITANAPTLRIEGEAVSGFSGCNQYRATVTAGEGKDLSIGRILGTLKACPPPADGIEARFLEALPEVKRWGFMMGQLTLAYVIDDDYRVLFFSRAGS